MKDMIKKFGALLVAIVIAALGYLGGTQSASESVAIVADKDKAVVACTELLKGAAVPVVEPTE